MDNNIKKIKTPQDYKETPIGTIPVEWELKKLDNILEFKNGVNGDKSRYGEGIKFINVMEVIYNNRITSNMISGSIMIPERQKNLFLVKKGDVLFNRTSETQEEIALAALYDDEEEVVFGGFVIRGRSKKNILINNFKKYCFDSSMMRKQIISKGQGAIRVNIGQSDLGKVKLPIPPLPEQKAIADCLSTWDKGIEELSALIASKKEQKKGLMQQLLTGKKRLDGFTEEWKEVRLGKYFKERNQRGFNDLDLLSIGAEGVYPQLDSNKKDTSNADKSKYKLIEIGDLGYNTMRLWQGRIALSNIRGIVSPAYTILIPQKGRVNSNYFSYLFKMPFVVNKFYRNSQGMVSDTLTCRYNDFKKIKLFIPSIEEQVAIAKVVTTAEKEIKTLEKKLEIFKSEKKGLMQVMLTGEKRLV